MRIVVFGGRRYANPFFLNWLLDCIHAGTPITCLIQGEADGADKWAKKWAQDRGVPTADFPADWDNITRPGAVVRTRGDGKQYDAAAGGVRNQQMIDEGEPVLGVGFPGGNGTADMAARLKRCGIAVVTASI
jgi:hypothetical protein